jgi:hypothetical protein
VSTIVPEPVDAYGDDNGAWIGNVPPGTADSTSRLAGRHACTGARGLRGLIEDPPRMWRAWF